MRRTARLAMAATLAFLGGITQSPAVGSGSYSMEILVDGRPLAEHRARGTTYVEARRDREYTIRLTNRTGERVAVALAVDGLNSIDARRSTAQAASKWILEPHQTITIDGWQTSERTARRFYFTTEDRSYGAWLGRTDDLGIVSAAFFRERLPRPLPFAPGRKSAERRQESGDAPRSRAKGEAEAGALAAPELSDDHAATGIGREVGHRVERVRFDARKRPAAVLQLRYEYRDALVRLGVLPRADDPLDRRERARGFGDYAPDPYRVRD